MFLGFGEVMARIATRDHRRWAQSVPGPVEVTWGGGEANVCASLAMLGNPARYVTALPDHAISRGLVSTLRGLGVDTSQILWRDGGRLGLYFVEVGSNQRGSTVLYDRAESAVALAAPGEFDFDGILQGVHWVHVSGITPAISQVACQTNLALVEAAKQAGATVSCDLNYRKKLWRWGAERDPKQLAREQMAMILPWVDVVIGNEEDAADVLDIHAPDTDVSQGHINAESYQHVARQIVSHYPNVQRVAITLRESISADHNNWGGMLYDGPSGESFWAPLDTDGRYAPYPVRDIVDRVGAGDSFAAGLLHALNSSDFATPGQAIQFAVAASCLKHTITGDFNYVTVEEVAALLAGNTTGRVQR